MPSAPASARILKLNFFATLPNGALKTEPSMVPDLSAARRSVSLPICKIVTSLGSMPRRFKSVRVPKSDDDANRMMPRRLPFRLGGALDIPAGCYLITHRVIRHRNVNDIRAAQISGDTGRAGKLSQIH